MGHLHSSLGSLCGSTQACDINIFLEDIFESGWLHGSLYALG